MLSHDYYKSESLTMLLGSIITHRNSIIGSFENKVQMSLLSTIALFVDRIPQYVSYSKQHRDYFCSFIS